MDQLDELLTELENTDPAAAADRADDIAAKLATMLEEAEVESRES